jgi:L,D-transpeptidase YcbB
MYHKLLPMNIKLSWLLPALLLFLFSCKEKKHHTVGQKEVVATKEELKVTVSEVLEASLDQAVENDGRLQGLVMKFPEQVKYLYAQRSYAALWTTDSTWLPQADSLRQWITDAYRFGLFPEDYYAGRLDTLFLRTVRDTSRNNRLDAALWAETELALSSAFVTMVSDLKGGRLRTDSARRADSTMPHSFFAERLETFGKIPVDSFAKALEPKLAAYQRIRTGLEDFLENADLTRYTLVDAKDSLKKIALLVKRLREDSITIYSEHPDSTTLSSFIKKFQAQRGWKADGLRTPAFYAAINDNDWERFIRIAITLDRYKQLPPLAPKYVWVNIPSYRLDVMDNDTSVLTSRVVVGKPITKTPIISSAISDMITYPLWHIPESIIEKEILPALKRDPGYLARKGYSLQDKDRNEVDPFTVNWSKYEKNIPYRVIQGQGDDNALGVLKFNFPNKFAVYLHDTNQRYLFSKQKRALSHGCVRVAAWNDLACYILAQDTAAGYHTGMDSLQVWLARKEKHYIPVRKKMPLHIRYFTCEGDNAGGITFHEDIYGDDRKLRLAYFATK